MDNQLTIFASSVAAAVVLFTSGYVAKRGIDAGQYSAVVTAVITSGFALFGGVIYKRYLKNQPPESK